MKRLTTVLASLALSGSALAADMPVKAPKQLIQAYPSESGMYWMAGAYGEATKIGVTPTVGLPASTFAAGGTLQAGGGYLYTFGPNRWIAIEGSINYANTGALQNGVKFDTRISGTQRLLYGGDLSMLTQWLPNLSTVFPVLPQLPASAIVCPAGTSCNPLTHTYIGAVLHEARNDVSMGAFSDKPVRVTYGATVGLITRLTDGSAIDTWSDITSSSGAHLMGGGVGLVAREGMTYRMGVTWKNGISRN